MPQVLSSKFRKTENNLGRSRAKVIVRGFQRTRRHQTASNQCLEEDRLNRTSEIYGIFNYVYVGRGCVHECQCPRSPEVSDSVGTENWTRVLCWAIARAVQPDFKHSSIFSLIKVDPKLRIRCTFLFSKQLQRTGRCCGTMLLHTAEIRPYYY